MNTTTRRLGSKVSRSLRDMAPTKARYLAHEAAFQLAAESYRTAVKALGPEPEWPAEGAANYAEADALCLARCEAEEALASAHGYHMTRAIRDAAAREVIRVSLAATAKAHPDKAADFAHLAAKADKGIPGLSEFDRILDVCMRGPY